MVSFYFTWIYLEPSLALFSFDLRPLLLVPSKRLPLPTSPWIFTRTLLGIGAQKLEAASEPRRCWKRMALKSLSTSTNRLGAFWKRFCEAIQAVPSNLNDLGGWLKPVSAGAGAPKAARDPFEWLGRYVFVLVVNFLVSFFFLKDILIDGPVCEFSCFGLYTSI